MSSQITSTDDELIVTSTGRLRAMLRAELDALRAELGQRPHSTSAMNSAARVPGREAAELLGCSERQVHRLVAAGRLTSTRTGKRLYITRESIDRVLAESTR